MLALAVVVLALLPRLAVLWETREVAPFTVPIGEAAVYDRAARSLLGDAGATPLLFWRSPTYVSFLAAIYGATEGSMAAVRSLQAFLGALTCGLIFALARRRLGTGLAAVSGLLAAWWGPLIFFDSLLLPVALAAFLSMVLIALLERASSREEPLWSSVFGGVAGIAVLTQLAFLPFAILALFWLGWTKRQTGLKGASGAIACGVVLLIAAGVSLATLGSANPLPRSGGFDVHLGNHPEACSLIEQPPRERWEALGALPAAAGESSLGMARTERELQLSGLSAGLVGKAGRLLSSREVSDFFDVYTTPGSKLLQVAVFKLGSVGFPGILLLPLAFLALARARGEAPLWLFLFGYGLALILTRAGSEQRVVLIPALAWAAALGLRAGIDAWQAPRPASKGIVLAVLVIGSLLAIVPGPFCEEEVPWTKVRDYELGAAYDERNDVPSAVRSYQQALEQDIQFAAAHRQLGRLFVEGGELDGAIAHYRSLLQLAPDAETHAVLAELLQRQGQNEEALVHRQALVELDPEDTNARLALGEALLAEGLYDRARVALEEAVRQEPEEARAHFALGGLYLRQGEVNEAITALETSLRLAPTAVAHNELGTALIGLQRLDEAAEHFRAAIAVDPDYLDAYSNAGAVSAMQGQLDAAGEYFSQAIQRDPGYVDARYNLAWVLLQQGEIAAAVSQLQEVLRRRPDHGKARQQLQALLSQSGEEGS